MGAIGGSLTILPITSKNINDYRILYHNNSWNPQVVCTVLNVRMKGVRASNALGFPFTVFETVVPSGRSASIRQLRHWDICHSRQDSGL